uniref:Uncharacterized protein n=1 Tax=Parascaris equorum TaxID=6256 RepID=A0A914RPS8_PAREQ
MDSEFGKDRLQCNDGQFINEIARRKIKNSFIQFVCDWMVRNDL